jgi:uncharacterized membrane protein
MVKIRRARMIAVPGSQSQVDVNVSDDFPRSLVPRVHLPRRHLRPVRVRALLRLALIGLVIAYIRGDDVAGSFLASHYEWLIRTFWWWALWWVAGIGIIAAGVIPNALVIANAARTGDYLTIPWSRIGAAIAGAFVLAFVWLWVVYRLTRGALRLSDGRAVPCRSSLRDTRPLTVRGCPDRRAQTSAGPPSGSCRRRRGSAASASSAAPPTGTNCDRRAGSR